MTEQEFDNVKWRLAICRSIDDRNYEVYGCTEIPGLLCIKRVYCKDGKTVRKEVVEYEYKGKVYSSKQKLLEVLTNG